MRGLRVFACAAVVSTALFLESVVDSVPASTARLASEDGGDAALLRQMRVMRRPYVAERIDVTTSMLAMMMTMPTTNRQNDSALGNADDEFPGGFTTVVNDGTDIFRPILPGADVPAANVFDNQQTSESPPPAEGVEGSEEPAIPSPDANGGEDGDGEPDDGETDELGDGDVCFPGSATVRVEGGGRRRMRDVRVGDRVHVGNGIYSPIFLFTHRAPTARFQFVRLNTASNHSLSLTRKHYLPCNGRLMSAGAVALGDVLTLEDGRFSPVVSIDLVFDSGLFNPHTMHGEIVVDGVRASTYTQTVLPRAAHALLAPLRAAFDALAGVALRGAFDDGAARLARFAPSGSWVV